MSYHLPTVYVSFGFQEINLLGSKYLTITPFLNLFKLQFLAVGNFLHEKLFPILKFLIL